MVLNWELQIDQAYTLFKIVVDIAVADGSQDFCHWEKTNLHMPSSPPPFELISPVFSLGSMMNAPSYLHGAVTSLQRFSLLFEVEHGIFLLRLSLQRLIKNKFLSFNSHKSTLLR